MSQKPDTHPAASHATPGAGPQEGNAQQADPRLLELLVCPLTKSTLEYNQDTNELISRAASLAFPIRSGVPMMIVDAARQLTDEEIERRNGRGGK
jgi:uncharacterized protein